MSERGIIFVGDVMDLGKRDEYIDMLKHSGRKVSEGELWYPIDFMKEVPAYISEICKISVGKKEKCTIENELTLYRYDVIYYIDKKQENHCKKTKFQLNKDWMEK